MIEKVICSSEESLYRQEAHVSVVGVVALRCEHDHCLLSGFASP